jgi:hypothetical protein
MRRHILSAIFRLKILHHVSYIGIGAGSSEPLTVASYTLFF